MKKFLTVLLVIAVMFTFSFGSAFAMNNTDANLIKQATAYAKAQLPEAVEKAYTVVLEDGTKDYITEAAWEAAAADIVEKLEAVIDAEEVKYLDDATIIDVNWNKYDVAYAAKALYDGLNMDYIDLAKWFLGDACWASVMAAEEQFEIDMEKATAVYDKVDLDALYSKTAPTADNSYYIQAEDAIADNKVALQEYLYNLDGTLKAEVVGTTVSAIADKADDLEGYIKTGVNGTKLKLTGVDAKYYDSTSVVKYYFVKGIDTKSDVEVNEAVDAAKTAAVKAQIAQNVAAYLAKYDTTAAKNFAADYSEVYGVLAEVNPDEFAWLVLHTPSEMEAVRTGKTYPIEAAVDTIDKLEATAAKYAAEKDENGVAVRDAAEIAKAVKKATVYEYADATALLTIYETEYETTEAFTAAKAAAVIDAMSVDMSAAKLAFDKDAKKAELADKLDGLVDDYYDLEYAAVKAEYEKAYAKIDAADEAEDFDAIVKALDKAVGKILVEKDVEDLFVNDSKMAKELKTQADALKAYVTYLNSDNEAYEDAFVENADEATLLRDYYIENNARTVAEMKALTGAVEAVAATLPTVGDIEAAAKAAKDAIKALPAVTKIAAADKDAIVAAFDLIEAYKDMCEIGGVDADAKIEIEDEIEALFEAIQDEFDLAFAKADKTDKAALKAIKADVAAANKELYAADGTKIFAPETTGKLVNVAADALAKIQKDEEAAVLKAIKAIPFNVTEADKAAVVAARELYDAYVAEYTNIDNAKTGFVADDFAPDYTDLVRAEAALGLNAEDPAYSVEALKITAKSSAKKGSITVKWTVEGDTSAVEGYEIWKSTKHSSGYKKMFTTTKMTYKNTKGLEKGTRYFYKVRAIAYTAEGEKVKSDFSNKARRIAK